MTSRPTGTTPPAVPRSKPGIRPPHQPHRQPRSGGIRPLRLGWLFSAGRRCRHRGREDPAAQPARTHVPKNSWSLSGRRSPTGIESAPTRKIPCMLARQGGQALTATQVLGLRGGSGTARDSWGGQDEPRVKALPYAGLALRRRSGTTRSCARGTGRIKPVPSSGRLRRATTRPQRPGWRRSHPPAAGLPRSGRAPLGRTRRTWP
jgi:hypothetical protein